MLHDQGADWKRHFAEFEFTSKTSPSEQLGAEARRRACPDRAMRAHGVNNAMALKTSAVWSLVSGDQSDRDAIHHALDVLDRYHGQPNGMFSADEHYAGRDPSQGIELCAVVEALFSLQQALAVTRRRRRWPIALERIAYNALPATFSADMWAHQYDQQPNQVLCTLAKRALGQQRARVEPVRPGAELRLLHGEHAPGLAEAGAEPLDGDAGRRPRGRARTRPSEVRTVVAGGVPVTIIEDTEYPFRDTVDDGLAGQPGRRSRCCCGFRRGPNGAVGA